MIEDQISQNQTNSIHIKYKFALFGNLLTDSFIIINFLMFYKQKVFILQK